MTQLRIATRSSAQARTQAENIGALIERMSPGVSVEFVFVDRWGSGMPNNAAGAENCVQVFGAGNQEGKLGDVDCNAKRPFYCTKYL